MTPHSYPENSYEIHNFVGIFLDPEIKPGSTTREDYMAPVDKATVLDRFAGFCPRLLSVIKFVSFLPCPALFSRFVPSDAAYCLGFV